MNIDIVCVGKLKDAYIKKAMEEYEKRLSRFCKFQVIELPDLSIPDNASLAEEALVLEKEGKQILAKLKPDAYKIAMCVEGKELCTEEFAEKIHRLGVTGKSHITFIIGGSLGLCPAVKAQADFSFSLSRLTLTHNMARLFLTEQIYRAFKINAGEKYHK